jgi:hypothetical protein
MKELTYRRLLGYWIGHRKITIHMYDERGRHSAFAISLPHNDEYIKEVRHSIDQAEVFQIGCGEPMKREAFVAFLEKSEERSPAALVNA